MTTTTPDLTNSSTSDSSVDSSVDSAGRGAAAAGAHVPYPAWWGWALLVACFVTGLVTATLAFDGSEAAIQAARAAVYEQPDFIDGDVWRAGTWVTYVLAVAAMAVSPLWMGTLAWVALVVPDFRLAARDHAAAEAADHAYNITLGPVGDTLLFSGVPAAVVLILVAGGIRGIRTMRAKRHIGRD